MARFRFGADDASVLAPPRSGVTVTFWTAQTGGTQYTDLLAADGVTAITSVISTTNGVLPEFYGPDTVQSMWADAGLARVVVRTWDAVAGGVSSFQGRTGVVSLSKADVTGTGLAAADVAADAAGAAATVNTTLSTHTANVSNPHGVTAAQVGAAKPRGAWVTATAYAVNDVITSGGAAYRCITAHTAGASFPGAGVNWEAWGSAASGPASTKVIVASGDTTGATDSAAIQAAINTLTASGGGIVDLVGTFWINTPIIWKTGVSLRGQGWTDTVINLASGSNCDMVQADTTLIKARLQDLTLDGYKENQTSGNGINLNTLTAAPPRPAFPGGAGLFIERVLVQFCKQRGYQSGTTGSGSVETRLTSLYCWANDAEGMYVDGSDAFLTDCTAGDNVNTGIYIKGGGIRLKGCKSWTSGYVSKNRANTTGYPTIGNSSANYEIRGADITMAACEAQDGAGVGFNFGGVSVSATSCNADANHGIAYQLYISGQRQYIQGIIGDGTSHGNPSSLAVHPWDSSVIGNQVRLTWPNNAGGVTAGVATSASAQANLAQNDVRIGTPNAMVAVAYAATVTPDPFYGGLQVNSVTGAITVANPAADRYVPNTEFEIVLTQDATGGRVVTFGADYLGMTAANTTASKVNRWRVKCIYNGTAAKWYQTDFQAY